MATPRRLGNIAFADTAHERGVTLIDVAIAVGLMIVTLIAILVASSRYMSQRTLVGWTDVIVSDVRAAQQLGIGSGPGSRSRSRPRAGTIAASTLGLGRHEPGAGDERGDPGEQYAIRQEHDLPV